MPAGKHKSRTLRRVFVRTPGSNTVMHYRRRKPSKAECAHCKQPLAGVQRSRGAKQRSNFKKSKSINRVIDYFYTCITNVMVADINGNQENSLENQENVLNAIQLIFII